MFPYIVQEKLACFNCCNILVAGERMIALLC